MVIKMSIVIGIDVGGSTTKIVGFDEKKQFKPLFVKATDPLASVYGAFGKFTAVNSISLDKISQVMITGVGSSFISNSIYGLKTTHVSEFEATGRGGLYLSGLDEAIIISMGTGTAIIHAKGEESVHMGGTGVGGGTIVGLSQKMLGISSVDHIIDLAKDGDLTKVDLRVSDITEKSLSPTLNSELTAANFGRLSDIATNSDIALGIINLVCETIAMMAVFAARHKQLDNIVLTGNLTALPQTKQLFAQLSAMFGLKFHIPELAQFGTVIGAALTYYVDKN